MDVVTNDAVEKFRTIESLWMSLESAEYQLEQALGGNVNMNEYYIATERIRNEYQVKKDKLAKARERKKATRTIPTGNKL
jgi:hypothetical protein